MKVKIITIHAMHNPGSVLQAYALQEYLNKKHEVEIINYKPDYFYNEGNKLKLLLKKTIYFKAYRERKEKFDSFINKNDKLTKVFKTVEQLENNEIKADCFIVGSDQLWNADFPCGNDPAFYLSFVKNGKKISYSTSVGKKVIDENNKKILKEKLKGFDSLSVREKSTSKELSILLNRNVKWVCDPVFLLSAKDYDKFIGKRVIDDKYALVYLSPKSETLDKIIEYYKNKGLKIILCGGMTKRCYCDKHIKEAGPEDFLSLIYHSEVVISTSFHATAFCHIFHKDFVSIPPKKNGERIISLLEQTKLENRAVVDDFDSKIVDKEINWKKVDEKLEEYIQSSKEYLDKALK